MIVVEQTGPLALIMDKGRPGLAHLGVSASGATDRTAYELGNRLIGNAPRAAAVEITAGGFQISVDALTWVAVTGAPTQVRVNSTPTASHTPIVLEPGDTLRVNAPPLGLRNYLCVRGGLRCPRTLGSRSTDTLSGLGPAPLREGDQLRVGVPSKDMPGIDLVAPNQPRKELEIDPGPRRDWFTEQAWRRLIGTAWSVTNDCDRVGVRLSGARLPRAVEGELPSEGLVRGAIQVPASGQPLIFLADHPVTGGYPVIAVLTRRDADHAGQLRPGDEVRFRARHRS